jgi:GntR family transcriptional regulator
MAFSPLARHDSLIYISISMPGPLFTISPGDGLTLYRQLVEQVKGAIAAGRLKPGDRLPTHRELAQELVIAPLTVKKAYDVLAAEGLISMSQGRGTFVAARPKGSEMSREARGDLEVRVERLVHQARLMHVSLDELRRLLTKHWEDT